jgi:DNA-binding PadR family transcriptional regulator
MGQTKGDVLSGTLDLLVLKTLARGPMHGYGITLHIQRRDGCMFCSRAESDTRGPASSTPARMSAPAPGLI